MRTKHTRKSISKLVTAIFASTRDERDDYLHAQMCSLYPSVEGQNS